MATNVLELRRHAGASFSGHLLRAASIADQTEIATAAAAIARAASEHGLRVMAWHNLATMESMTDAAGDPLNIGVFGWDDAALAPWLAADAAVRSPLVKLARVASEPLWINRDGAFPAGKNRFVDQMDRTGFEAFCGARAAIILPVRIPFGHIAAAILTSTDPLKTDLSVEFAAFAEHLAVPLHHFVRSYATLMLDDRYLPNDTLLTSREIECLNWVAQGKTDFEISIILGSSHAGVRYHITRVCAKLGAVNRAQSVFKACQLGYLGVPSQRPGNVTLRSGGGATASLAC